MKLLFSIIVPFILGLAWAYVATAYLPSTMWAIAAFAGALAIGFVCGFISSRLP